MISYQVARYAKKEGVNLEGISDEQRLILTEKMIKENYPGNITGLLKKMKVRTSLFFPGLTTSPKALKETMLPNISPESVADTKIQVSGGYDPCQFGVSINFIHRGHYFDLKYVSG